MIDYKLFNSFSYVCNTAWLASVCVHNNAYNKVKLVVKSTTVKRSKTKRKFLWRRITIPCHKQYFRVVMSRHLLSVSRHQNWLSVLVSRQRGECLISRQFWKPRSWSRKASRQGNGSSVLVSRNSHGCLVLGSRQVKKPLSSSHNGSSVSFTTLQYWTLKKIKYVSFK